MRIQETWLIRFKEVVQREIDEAGGKPADGYRAVATKTGLGYDYIYQIFMGKPVKKPKLPGHDAMTAIERVYGGAKNSELTSYQTPCADSEKTQPVATTDQPTLAQALEVVLNALAESPHRTELRQLLPMVVDTNATAYRQRLGELLAPAKTPAATPALQQLFQRKAVAQTADFAATPTAVTQPDETPSRALQNKTGDQ